jgi:hypothetical protein
MADGLKVFGIAHILEVEMVGHNRKATGKKHQNHTVSQNRSFHDDARERTCAN